MEKFEDIIRRLRSELDLALVETDEHDNSDEINTLQHIVSDLEVSLNEIRDAMYHLGVAIDRINKLTS